MKLIYISGRYRDLRGEYYVNCNIQTAAQYALKVWAFGGVAICPHLNTAHFGGALGISDTTWLLGDLEILSRCDAIVMLPGWEGSQGAIAELEFAQGHNIPILMDDAAMFEFLDEDKAK